MFLNNLQCKISYMLATGPSMQIGGVACLERVPVMVASVSCAIMSSGKVPVAVEVELCLMMSLGEIPVAVVGVASDPPLVEEVVGVVCVMTSSEEESWLPWKGKSVGLLVISPTFTPRLLPSQISPQPSSLEQMETDGEKTQCFREGR